MSNAAVCPYIKVHSQSKFLFIFLIVPIFLISIKKLHLLENVLLPLSRAPNRSNLILWALARLSRSSFLTKSWFFFSSLLKEGSHRFPIVFYVSPTDKDGRISVAVPFPLSKIWLEASQCGLAQLIGQSLEPDCRSNHFKLYSLDVPNRNQNKTVITDC